MSVVTLVSGGLDSSVMATLAHEAGLTQFPLFVDYGQLGRDRELRSCQANLRRLGLPEAAIASLPGYAALLPSGLSDRTLDIVRDAFLPCRNALFLIVAGAYAHRVGASAVNIGLLDEASSIFPDQTRSFLRDMEALLCRALGKELRVIAPLMSFSKADVAAIAREKGVAGTYSCHAGGPEPCGQCISCRELQGVEV